VPNTAPGSVVHAFRLVPKNGGAGQTFLYTGETPFTGTEPMGAYPAPISAWLPELDPTRSYCLTVGASGDGDLARLPVESQTICADVVQLSAAGAPPPPQTGGGGGGCSVAGAGPGARAALLFLALVFGLAARRRR
jgi:MYXO-CTERM domain-containing protein